MTQTQRILLIAPLKNMQSPAFERAIELAHAFSASLHIVAFVHAEVVEIFSHFGAGAADNAHNSTLEVFRSWLQTETSAMRQKGLDATFEVVWGPGTAIEMAAYIEKSRADLVIKDLEDVLVPKRMTLTAIDRELSRISSRPILYARENCQPRAQKILVAVQLSAAEDEEQTFNDLLIRSALDLANACRTALHLVSVYDRAALLGARRMQSMPGKEVPDYEYFKGVFDTLADRFGIPAQHRHYIVGAYVNSIVGYTERCGYDLVVLGMEQDKEPDSAVQNILGHLTCSALVVKPLTERQLQREHRPLSGMPTVAEAANGLTDSLDIPGTSFSIR